MTSEEKIEIIHSALKAVATKELSPYSGIVAIGIIVRNEITTEAIEWANSELKRLGMEDEMDEAKSQIIYELEVGKDLPKKHLYEDTPEAYRVEKADTASGIIIYGRYPGGRWIVNPSCRELVAHLIRTL